MSTITITAENLQQHVSGPGITLLDFWAEWCGPCRFFGPIFERASEQHPDVTFGKVNTEEQQELARAFRIQSIPTLMAFRDGVLLFHQAGALPETALSSLITQIRSLDMQEIQAEISARATT